MADEQKFDWRAEAAPVNLYLIWLETRSEWHCTGLQGGVARLYQEALGGLGPYPDDAAKRQVLTETRTALKAIEREIVMARTWLNLQEAML